MGTARSQGHIRLGQLRLHHQTHELRIPALLPACHRRHLALIYPTNQTDWAESYLNSLIVRIVSAIPKRASWIKAVLGGGEAKSTFLESLESIATAPGGMSTLQIDRLELGQLASPEPRRQWLGQRLSEQRVVVVYGLTEDHNPRSPLLIPKTTDAANIVRAIAADAGNAIILLGIQVETQSSDGLPDFIERQDFEVIHAPSRSEPRWRLKTATNWQGRGLIEGYQFQPDEELPDAEGLIRNLHAAMG